MVKDADKPRGRTSAYSYFLQACREEHKKLYPHENVVFAEFSKKCSERWRTMDEKAKARFHEMANKDKARYDSEMKNYVPPSGAEAKGKKRKAVKDPNAPKRALSAFFCFCQEERPAVRLQNPGMGVGEVAKELGKRWNALDQSAKARFEGMAENDKARYETEMASYNKRCAKGNPNGNGNDMDDEYDDEEDDE